MAGRIIRIAVIAAVVLLVVLGFWQWRVFETKTTLREESLLYFQEEDYTKAIEYLESALDKKSVFAGGLDVDMKCYLAESYCQMEDYDAAEEIYDALIAANSDNARFYQQKGSCAMAAKDEEKAADIYEEGYEQTGDSDLLYSLCRLYVEQEDYENALRVAEEGENAGEDAKQEFLYLKVIILEKSQDYAAAYETVCDYCSLFPDDEEAQKEKIFLSTRID